MATQGKEELLENLRSMMRDMLRLRSEGGAYAKLARAHGYVDGYMRVLLEAGIADQKALLALVADERRKFDGPSTRELVSWTTMRQRRKTWSRRDVSRRRSAAGRRALFLARARLRPGGTRRSSKDGRGGAQMA
jgi:hypothetical protein